MLIIDKFRRRNSKERSFSVHCDRVDSESIDSRKIIDFESARRAFERDHPTNEQGEESQRTSLSDFSTDRSAAGMAESLVTIVLALILGLSLLLGMVWGF
jgi:hypothetical protein